MAEPKKQRGTSPFTRRGAAPFHIAAELLVDGDRHRAVIAVDRDALILALRIIWAEVRRSGLLEETLIERNPKVMSADEWISERPAVEMAGVA